MIPKEAHTNEVKKLIILDKEKFALVLEPLGLGKVVTMLHDIDD